MMNAVTTQFTNNKVRLIIIILFSGGCFRSERQVRGSRSPKIAVPTRTIVAPSSIATSKS
jgi:hypothetical protein